jgi:hypothetical protein
MKAVITSVDYAPEELDAQTPFMMDLLRQLPGTDRPDYWLAKLDKPLYWNDQGCRREIYYVILAARWVGTAIGKGMKDLPVGIAYVIDETVVTDAELNLAKCKYIAIGATSSP